MGYLLKINNKIKMFYTKPELGCYANDIMMVSKREYEEHYSKKNENEFVFIDGWFDTSAELGSKESVGIDVIDDFVLCCILQGGKLEENRLYEFGLIS